MIQMYARYDAHGRYTWFGNSSVDQDLTGPGIYVGTVDRQLQYHDAIANGPVNIPPRPSPNHVFDYGSKTWILNSVEAWNAVKRRRDDLLTATDWRVTRFIETGYPVAPEWTAYRQALRDITLQTDPTHIVWPEPPA